MKKSVKCHLLNWKQLETLVFSAASSTSITLTVTGFEMVIIPLSSGVTSAFWSTVKIKKKILTIEYNIYQNRYERLKQSNRSFDKLYGKCLQDNWFE